MKLKKNGNGKEHEKVEKQLDKYQRQLEEHARRLRILEIEAGIYKPPLKGVTN